MDKEKNKENDLPIVLVVQDANKENIQRATDSLNYFYNACSYLEDSNYVLINTLVCSTVCYWLQDHYESIKTASKYRFSLGEDKVDITKVILALKNKPLSPKPIIVFFLTNEFTDESFNYVEELAKIPCAKIIVDLTNSPNNRRLFASFSFLSSPVKEEPVSIGSFLEFFERFLLIQQKEKELENEEAYEEDRMEQLCLEQLRSGNRSCSFCVEDDIEDLFLEDEEEPTPGSEDIDFSKSDIPLVNYSLISEKEIKRNANFVIDFAMYIDEYENIIEKVKKNYQKPTVKSGVIPASIKSAITLILHSPNLPDLYDEETFVWNGMYNVTTLSGYVDKKYQGDNLLLIVDILINGIKISSVKTTVDLLNPLVGEMPFFKEDVKRVFFSYSSFDRDTVVEIVQKTIAMVGYDVEFFLDVLKLRAGDDWQKRIYQEIDSSDSFCLIWSYHALKSKWVKKEWKYALSKKGLSSFNPINISYLDNKHKAPIPRELNKIHFANYGVLNKYGV